jgi:hypothetical protein
MLTAGPIWDAASGSFLHALKVHYVYLRSVAFFHDSKLVPS